MKHRFAAAACAPLRIACASAGAQSGAAASADEDAETRILVVNGQRIVLNGDGDASSAIEDALENMGDDRRIRFEFNSESEWSQEQREAFASVMARLGEHLGQTFADGVVMEFDGEMDFEFDVSEFDGENMRIQIERLERQQATGAQVALRVPVSR